MCSSEVRTINVSSSLLLDCEKQTEELRHRDKQGVFCDVKVYKLCGN